MRAVFNKYCVQMVNAILALRLLLYIFSMLHYILSPFTLDSHFGQTEFLINYRGGFVRRGMFGEILYKLATDCNIDIQYIIGTVIWLSFIGLAYVFVRLLQKNNVCWWIIQLNFTFFGADFIRKDYLCMLLVVGIIYFLNKDSMNRWSRYITICLLSIALYNLHEAFFFVIGPFATYYLLFKDRAFKSFTARLLWQLPVWGCFILLLKYHGDVSTALAIQNSWHEVYPSQIPVIDETACEFLAPERNSITALGWNTSETLHFHHSKIYIPSTLSALEPAGYIAMPLFYLLIMLFLSRYPYLFCKKTSILYGRNYTSFFLVVLFVFASMSPLYFGLSCDIARLCMYWSITSLSILFIMGQKKIEELFPTSLNHVSEKANIWVDNVIKRPKLACVAVIIFVGSPIYSYNFLQFITNSVFGAFFYTPYIWLRVNGYLVW